MAKLSKIAFVNKYNSLFADNSTRLITEGTMRTFTADLAASFLNTTDQNFDGVQGDSPGISTITDLKAIVTVGLSIGVFITFRDTDNGGVLRSYELVAGTDAELSPSTLRPLDYDGTTNQKVWKLASIYGLMNWDMSTDEFPEKSVRGQRFYGIDGPTPTLTGMDGSRIPNGVIATSLEDGAAVDDPTKWALEYTVTT